MNDVRALIDSLEDHLAQDTAQLARLEQQADAVANAYADLRRRIGLEVAAAAGRSSGACHLRG